MREREYGRVDRKITVGNMDTNEVPVDAEHAAMIPPQTTVVERPKSDKRRSWRTSRPHPMTAISCHDPTWAAALNAAWAKYHQDGSPSPSLDLLEAPQEPSRDIETIEDDLSLEDMIRLEPYLPREPPNWVVPYVDKTAQLSKRETAGHLIPSVENGEPALYFVFSDLAIRTEGYFALRLHVVNLEWRVDARFSRQGPGLFAPLADCVTDTFAVYSTKEFPGLPPTTEFTTYLVRQGVRIRFRDDRAVDAAVGERRRVEGKPRPPRRSSQKSNEGNSPEEANTLDATRVSSSSPVSPNFDGVKVDLWNPEMIRAATEAVKNSPMSLFGSLARMDVHDDRLSGADLSSPSSAYPPFSPHEGGYQRQIEPSTNQPYIDSIVTGQAFPVHSGHVAEHTAAEPSRYVQTPVWNEPNNTIATNSPVIMQMNWKAGSEQHYVAAPHPQDVGPSSYHQRDRRPDYRFHPYPPFTQSSPEPISPQHSTPSAPQYPGYHWSLYGPSSQPGPSYSGQYSNTSSHQSPSEHQDAPH
ncbi:hypothetical protein FRC15_001829 [Serendipita sp. 397]|nr:hypothetical protein FRC15_001829 [Serendipita sp. 397]